LKLPPPADDCQHARCLDQSQWRMIWLVAAAMLRRTEGIRKWN